MKSKNIISLLLLSIISFKTSCCQDLISDSVYYISFRYQINSNDHPKIYTALLQKDTECLLDVSDYGKFINSLQCQTQAVDYYVFSNYDMVNNSYSDSSESFRKQEYNNNLIRWIDYVSSNDINETIIQIGEGKLFISVALFEAIIKIDVNNPKFPYSIATINNIVPMRLMKDIVNHKITISKKTLFGNEKTLAD